MRYPMESGLFATTLIALFFILSLSILTGRVWTSVSGSAVPRQTREYTEPILGLALITVLLGNFGRSVVLGNTVTTPLVTMIIVTLAVLLETDRRDLGRRVFTITIFGCVCGISLLVPLYLYGAFNTHTDAFTYLAHSNWLQDHAFNQNIPHENITPLNTQIALYQHASLRMGASLLLAFFQGTLNLKSSLYVYPALMISGIAMCCLAIGIPLARSLRRLGRIARFSILASCAFSVGGVVFGANFGFLAQTIGLAFACAALFSLSHLAALSRPSVTIRHLFLRALPVATLMSAAVFTYSEMAPFLFLSVTMTVAFWVFKLGFSRKVWMFGALVASLTVTLLNIELVRAFKAIINQAGVVVGTPVDWSPFGFIGHGFGMRAGVWEGPLLNYVGLLWALLLGAMFFFGIKRPGRLDVKLETLLPSVTILVLFAIAFLYFRYVVPSPFPTGTGQSWSQFKLSEWAQPFVLVLVLGFICGPLPRNSKRANFSILAAVSLMLSNSVVGSVWRIQPLISYYGRPSNLSDYYAEFRDRVTEVCAPTAPIYLRLGGPHHKFRQMALLQLGDRIIKSDWTDDSFITGMLPDHRRQAELEKGDCLVEPRTPDDVASAAFGAFRISTVDDRNRFLLKSSKGHHGQEGADGNSWWWIGQAGEFEFEPQMKAQNTSVKPVSIEFDFLATSDQNILVEIVPSAAEQRKYTLAAKKGDVRSFREIVDLPIGRPLTIRFSTEGLPARLSANDPRTASLMVRNLSLKIQ